MLRRRLIDPVFAVIIAFFGVSAILAWASWWWLLGLGAVWLAITAIGSFFIQMNYHLTSLNWNKNNTENSISLTFDDGPDPVFTPKTLDLLKKYQAKATFFCIGQKANQYPEIIQRIVAEGHTLGNHTFGHAVGFGFFGTNRVINELNLTHQTVAETTGLRMIMYRPAFGVTNPMIERAVKQLRLVSIGWSVRSLDTTSRSSGQVLRRITSQLKRGDVVLLHDTSQKTLVVLEQLLLFLQQKKLESVTVDQLLNLKAYE